MRLSHILVVLAATFLATGGALADTNTAFVAKINSAVEPSHRLLRTYKTEVEEDFEDDDDDDDEEERGLKRIPREQLDELALKVGVRVDDVLANADEAMRGMTRGQLGDWINGINELKRVYKKAKSPRYSNY